MARAASPELAYRIGQEFKNNELKNQTDNGNRPEEQSPQHLLAHAVLGAAVSYATGNDIATGAISAVSNEAGAKVLANYLYHGKDPKDLTQEQKDTITSILNLATATTIYTTTDGSAADAVSAAEIGKVGAENNYYGWGGEAWAYAVGGGKEYAQSQASLGAYCANQSDYATCMGWKKQDLWSGVIELHQKYNHMTIMSVSRGGVEQIFIINNKNGNVYSSLPIPGATLTYDELKRAKTRLPVTAGARTPGGSVTFGSILSGRELRDEEIDAAIQGLSFSTQICHVFCLGTGITKDGVRVNQYGLGSSGAGVSVNHMVLISNISKQELRHLIRQKTR